MRVLLTGVSGFVGRRLAAHLHARGDSLASTYIDPRPELPEVSLYKADLLDLDGMREVVADAEPEVVIHLGGLSHVGESWRNPGAYFRVNVLGTENLLRAAEGVCVVLASSAEVYGLVPAGSQPISEDEPVDPQSPYALTKAAAERLTVAAGGVVVRCFNLVGPGQEPTFALPAFARQLAAIRRGEQEPVLKVGNLAARRDFLHVDDAVVAYRMLGQQRPAGETLNLGSGQDHSIEEALELLLEISGVEARVEIDPERFRPVDVPLLRGDATRLRGLGWEPARTLRQALEEVWQEAAG